MRKGHPVRALLVLSALLLPCVLAAPLWQGRGASLRPEQPLSDSERSILRQASDAYVYVFDRGGLRRVGKNLPASEDGTEWPIQLFAADSGAASWRVAFVLPNNLLTLWRLQRDARKGALKERLAEHLSALTCEFAALRDTPRFRQSYAPRFEAILADAARTAAAHEHVQSTVGDSMAELGTAVREEVLPVAAHVAGERSLFRAGQFVEALTLERVWESTKQTAIDVYNGETQIRSNVRRLLTDFTAEVFSAPETKQAMVAVLAKYVKSGDAETVAKTFSAAFLSAVSADPRTGQTLADMMRDPEMAASLESFEDRMVETLDAVAKQVFTEEGGESMDPFVAQTVKASLFRKERYFVLLTDAKQGRDLVSAGFRPFARLSPEAVQ